MSLINAVFERLGVSTVRVMGACQVMLSCPARAVAWVCAPQASVLTCVIKHAWVGLVRWRPCVNGVLRVGAC